MGIIASILNYASAWDNGIVSIDALGAFNFNYIIRFLNKWRWSSIHKYEYLKSNDKMTMHLYWNFESIDKILMRFNWKLSCQEICGNYNCGFVETAIRFVWETKEKCAKHKNNTNDSSNANWNWKLKFSELISLSCSLSLYLSSLSRPLLCHNALNSVALRCKKCEG